MNVEHELVERRKKIKAINESADGAWRQSIIDGIIETENLRAAVVARAELWTNTSAGYHGK